jgi:hypothetical protein
VDDRPGLSDAPSDHFHHLPEGKRFGSERIHGDVFISPGLRYRKLRKIFHVDGTDGVFSVSEHAEYGKSSQHPGDVVDEDSLFSEKQGRALALYLPVKPKAPVTT